MPRGQGEACLGVLNCLLEKRVGRKKDGGQGAQTSGRRYGLNPQTMSDAHCEDAERMMVNMTVNITVARPRALPWRYKPDRSRPAAFSQFLASFHLHNSLSGGYSEEPCLKLKKLRQERVLL